jgi:hypothetical protein
MLQKARALAEAKGGACLADVWKNVTTKIPWRCSIGHVWETTYSKVGYTKAWCPKCAAIKTAQTLRDRAYDVMIVTALKHNFRCEVSKEDYINVLQKVGWTCLKCSKHFVTGWNTLATTCKFSCWECELIAKRGTLAFEEEQKKLAEQRKIDEAKRVENRKIEEANRAEARKADQKAIAEQRAKDTEELLSKEQPRYSKTESRMDRITTFSGCSSCQSPLESYNKDGMCSQCDAREWVKNQALCRELDELLQREKAVNARLDRKKGQTTK